MNVPAPATAHRGAATQQRAPAPERGDRRERGRSRARLADRTRPLRIELGQIESRLARIGTEREALEATLAANALAPAEIAEAGRQLNHIAAETAQLEERWLALSGEIETMAAE